MRAVVATLLALVIVASTAAAHVHVHPSGGDDCAVCVLRHTAPPGGVLVDVAPVVHVEPHVATVPTVPPVHGAPLGAVPGQSPPAAA